MTDTLLPSAEHPAAGADPAPAAGWLRRLADYCLRHRADLVLAFVGAFASSAVAALTPLVARHVIDAVSAGRDISVTPWALLLVAAGVVRFVAGATRRYRAGRLGLDVQLDLRNDLLSSVRRLDGRRQDELATGQLVSRSISDLQLVQGLLFFVPNLTGNVLLFFVSLGIMLVLSPLLTLVALAVAPALWLVALRSRRQLFPANWHAQQSAAEIAGAVEAAVTGVRVVKGFGQERRELARVERLSDSLFASKVRVVRISSVWNPLLQAVPALGQVGILAFGGWLALRGSITLGTFLAFSTYIGALVAPVRQLGALLVVGQQARAGLERVLEIIDLTPTVAERAGARPVPGRRGEPVGVSFEHVSFGYDPERPVLRDFSLQIRPGETVALVGASGSGKSTVTELVSRLYDVQGGRVLVGGIDIRDATLASLRQRLGVVPEDAFLFSDTVHNNLAYARPDAREDELVAAARAAQAHEFIEALPEGYDTTVGEQGLTLSGGQRQRVALARALVTAPDVLVLDDATSAIDPSTEARIHDALRPLLRDRAALIVAHRRSTLELADRVAVLEGGRVVDEGTIDELDARSPVFRRLLSGELPPEGSDPGGPAAAVRIAAPAPMAAAPSRLVTATAAAAAGGGGGMMSGLAAVPITPELSALLEKLPPADDRPEVELAEAEAPDLDFSLQRLLRPFLPPLLLGLLLVGLDAGAQIAVPAIVRTAVDKGVSADSLRVLLMASGLAALVVSLDWLVNMAQQRVTGRTGERLLFVLRVKTFAHLQRLGLDYYERELAGRIMTRMTTDVDALSQFLQTGLTSAVVSVLSIVGVLIAMIVLDAPLAGVLAATLPVLVVATWFFRRRTVPIYAESRERVSAVNARFQEGVSGLRLTQLSGREDLDATAFADAGRAYRDSRLRAQRYISGYFPGVELLSEVATALVLLAGASRVREGTLTAGALIAFLLYVELFFSPVQQLSQVFDGYQQAAVGLRRLRELLRTPTSTPWTSNPLPLGRVRGRLDLSDVRFRYGAEGSAEAIRGLSLHIEAGEDVALVGATGAGKSTVLKLIARFYDPTEGSVQIDGRDLRELDLEAYRQQLGYVPQEAYLFEGTVRESIAYGRPDASDQEVQEAAEAVGAHEMILSLAGGYDAAVGERGRGLSAGQRQLLSLARAELVDPAVLLLDEATAALDLATEAAVRRATDRLRRRRTTITVAHRLQSAVRAGRVIVLDQGRVVEDGTHDELVLAGGPYAELWASYGAHRVTG